METFETEALFALFYAWTQQINTSFHLVLLINEKISSVNVYILLSIRTPDFWTVSFRYRISSISKLYYRRTFMIVDIPSVESGEKAIFNVFIFLMFLYSADEENIFSSRQKWSLWIIQNLKNVKDSPRLHKAIHKYYTSMTVYWSKHYFPKTIIEMSIDVH